MRFSVYRFDPSTDSKKRYETYEVPYWNGMTVLDGLLYIKERIDHTLAIRYSCRMGICGSCGMTVNGLPKLACYTQVKEVGMNLKVEPLRNHPLVRDLVTDFADFFQKHRSVRPWLIRKDIEEQENPTSQYLQSDAELERYVQFSYCISCGLCMEVCPVKINIPMSISKVKGRLAESRGSPRSSRAMMRYETFARVASRIAPLANALMSSRAFRELMERVVGLDSDVEMPRLSSKTLTDRLREERSSVENPRETIVLFPDFFYQYVR
ncbi:MAG: 2Fe-2S iron-sulfur cluster-binding protein, partial [Aigarchaeota archaeon]|nr:2Fe-2S iron-sulfur cluster-binding protein [Aigarchaeota archaeon]